MRIRFQLALIFMLVIFLSVALVTGVLSNNTFRFMKENAVSNYSRMNSQIAVNIDGIINSIDHYYDFLISNRVLFNNLRNEDFGKSPDSYDSVIHLKELLFSIISITDGLHSAFFFSASGGIVSSLSGVIYPEYLQEKNLKNQSFFKEIYNSPAQAVWLTSEVENSGYVFYMRGIRDPSTGEVLGILCFVIYSEVFESNIYMLSGGSENVYICDETGQSFISNAQSSSLILILLMKLQRMGRVF